MLKLYLFFMMFNSVCMMTLKTPMSMGLILLTQTILSTMVMRFMVYSSWLSLTLFLMMVSGLMIIFTYVTSICANNKFKFINSKMILYLPLILIIIFNFKMTFTSEDSYQLKDTFNYEFFKLYTSMNMLSSLFMFIYLLIILIIMINMLNSNKGPLRKKY